MLASAQHLSEHLGAAPVLILACVDTDGAKPTLSTGASIYPAVQNIMLAARALGVGSCITTIHKYRDPQVKELLGIPAEVETAALIPLGYPLGKFGCRRAGPSPRWRTRTNGDRRSWPEAYGAGARGAERSATAAMGVPIPEPGRRRSQSAAGSRAGRVQPLRARVRSARFRTRAPRAKALGPAPRCSHRDDETCFGMLRKGGAFVSVHGGCGGIIAQGWRRSFAAGPRWLIHVASSSALVNAGRCGQDLLRAALSAHAK